VKGKKMALVRHPAALEDDCRSADIVIAPFTIGKRCRAARVIIDRRMLRAQGAYALFTSRASQSGQRVRTVRSSKRRHPRRRKATMQPTPISDRAAIQKNKDQ
jgi:competence protein ComEC